LPLRIRSVSAGEGFLDVGVGIRAVQLVEVDVVGPQPSQ